LSKIIEFKSVKEMPPLVVSFETTLYNKTGSWRYLRPVYHDKTAPCVEGCPAGEDIEGYMYFVAQGKFDEAWELIMKENPFPAVCGRVCYHPCEMSCNRGEYDDSLGINGIERVIGDHGLHLDVEKLRVRNKNSHRIAVVGSGPSGLTCAYHLARLGYNVTVFESHKYPGGVLRTGIPEYRLPKDVLEKEIGRIQKLGVIIETNTRVGKDVLWKDLMAYDAVYLASGVHLNRKLNVSGED
jgi:NADPH-dependent glutamate synthase beta subunit-like oxidoreductase